MDWCNRAINFFYVWIIATIIGALGCTCVYYAIATIFIDSNLNIEYMVVIANDNIVISSKVVFFMLLLSGAALILWGMGIIKKRDSILSKYS